MVFLFLIDLLIGTLSLWISCSVTTSSTTSASGSAISLAASPPTLLKIVFYSILTLFISSHTEMFLIICDSASPHLQKLLIQVPWVCQKWYSGSLLIAGNKICGLRGRRGGRWERIFRRLNLLNYSSDISGVSSPLLVVRWVYSRKLETGYKYDNYWKSLKQTTETRHEKEIWNKYKHYFKVLIYIRLKWK